MLWDPLRDLLLHWTRTGKYVSLRTLVQLQPAVCQLENGHRCREACSKWSAGVCLLQASPSPLLVDLQKWRENGEQMISPPDLGRPGGGRMPMLTPSFAICPLLRLTLPFTLAFPSGLPASFSSILEQNAHAKGLKAKQWAVFILRKYPIYTNQNFSHSLHIML